MTDLPHSALINKVKLHNHVYAYFPSNSNVFISSLIFLVQILLVNLITGAFKKPPIEDPYNPWKGYVSIVLVSAMLSALLGEFAVRPVFKSLVKSLCMDPNIAAGEIHDNERSALQADAGFPKKLRQKVMDIILRWVEVAATLVATDKTFSDFMPNDLQQGTVDAAAKSAMVGFIVTTTCVLFVKQLNLLLLRPENIRKNALEQIFQQVFHSSHNIVYFASRTAIQWLQLFLYNLGKTPSSSFLAPFYGRFTLVGGDPLLSSDFWTKMGVALAAQGLVQGTAVILMFSLQWLLRYSSTEVAALKQGSDYFPTIDLLHSCRNYLGLSFEAELRPLLREPEESDRPTKFFWEPDMSHLIIRPALNERFKANEKEKKWIQALYDQSPVRGHKILKIEAFYRGQYNEPMTYANYFVTEVGKLQSNSRGSTFEQRWRQNTSEQDLEWRKQVYKLFEGEVQSSLQSAKNVGLFPFLQSKRFSHERWNQVSFAPLWYGTSEEAATEILRTRYVKQDNGSFGSGIYTTNSAEYAYRVYASGRKVLLLNWVAYHLVYPIIGRDLVNEKKYFKPRCEPGDIYDTSVVAVVPDDPNHLNTVEDYHCCPMQQLHSPMQQPHYIQIISKLHYTVFPAYLVTLAPESVR